MYNYYIFKKKERKGEKATSILTVTSIRYHVVIEVVILLINISFHDYYDYHLSTKYPMKNFIEISDQFGLSKIHSCRS